MPSLAIILGKAMKKNGMTEKKGSEDMEDDADESTSSVADDYAREAFQALKDDDEDAFVEAFLGAVRCADEAEE